MDDIGWPLGSARSLSPHQRTEVWVVEVASGTAELVYTDQRILLEAPNWAPDGEALLLNGDGLLWRLDLHPDTRLTQVLIQDLPPINNDHVVDAERGRIYLSANDGHIYVAPITGGSATRVTHDSTRYHFLHGLSPDGRTLAFVDLPAGDVRAPGRLAVIPSTGGDTTYPDAGSHHIDGPEFSADGAWIYLNSEEFGHRPGHAQIVRLPAAGGPREQLVHSDTVDWFPHVSPDGRFATYLSFPTGTLGHPADLDVVVHLVDTSSWGESVARFPVFGGQGTLNVDSWAPDSRHFAFVAYPIEPA